MYVCMYSFLDAYADLTNKIDFGDGCNYSHFYFEKNTIVSSCHSTAQGLSHDSFICFMLAYCPRSLCHEINLPS